MMQPKDRPTARQLASMSGEDPWACPHCGCRGPHRVANTYMVQNGENRRRRICRACGQGLVRTSEVPVPDGYRIAVVPDEE